MTVPTSGIISKYELQRPTLFFYLLACLSVLGLVINELIRFEKHKYFLPYLYKHLMHFPK